MESHTFTTQDNQRFWEGNTASYQGEENAQWLIFLARPYLGRRILDAGAGDGSLVKEVRKRLPDAAVTGVDLAPKDDVVEQGDLKRLKYDDESFDTIFCSEVIEHVTPGDTSEILTELRRLLSPGGVLVLTTPYAEKLEESIVTCPGCNVSFHRWGHQQTFVEEDFAGLARDHGFEAIANFPVRYSRVRRLRFLGPNFFRGAYMHGRVKRMKGKRHLILIARKTAATN